MFEKLTQKIVFNILKGQIKSIAKQAIVSLDALDIDTNTDNAIKIVRGIILAKYKINVPTFVSDAVDSVLDKALITGRDFIVKELQTRIVDGK